MKNDFKPFVGIDLISFGSDRNNIRDCLNQNYQEFLRNQFAENTSDFYKELGYFIEYNKENICNAIEFTNESNLYLNDDNLFDYDYDSLRRKFDHLSFDKEEEDGFGVTYYDLGFGVSKVYGQNKIETIIIFSKEYW